MSRRRSHRGPLASLSTAVFLAVFGGVCPMGMGPPPPAGPVGSWGRAAVSLVDNGYRGLVLAVADGVPEDPELLDQIKTLFAEASSFLYQATDHRAYLHELTILAPESWPDDPSYRPAFTESFHTANILVNTAAGPDIPSRPFVKQPGMCGEEGAYLHLTRELIGQGNRGPWGNLSRVLVHEWGHLRWGLFDEYPGPDDLHFYLDSAGNVEPVRCSKNVSGVAVAVRGGQDEPAPGGAGCPRDAGGYRGRLPDRRCRFQPHGNQSRGASGSLMYAQFVDQITGFCHSNVSGDAGSLHNPEAPNRQNALCGGRSAWDVMMTSRDFAGGANRPREGAVTPPRVTVKRAVKRRVVLVLDASGSMNENRKFEKLLRASSFYLTDVFPKDTWVALVQFNVTASVLAPLTKLRYRSSRQSLVEKLPHSAGGNSSIGAGILKAQEVLSTDGKSPQGGVILVMSDGREDTPPFVRDVAGEVRSRGVVLDALAYSGVVTENFLLPSAGGGGSFFVPFAENGTDATEGPAARDAAEDEEFQDQESFLTIVRRTEMLPGHGNGTDYVHIDSTVGINTIFRFIWETGAATAAVTTPGGLTLDSSRPEYSMDMESRKVEIRIRGIAQPGSWSYRVQNTNERPQAVRVHVYSRASSPLVPPVRARAHIKRTQVNLTEESRVILYGEVTQGERPVIRAGVKALVKRPGDGVSSEYLVVQLRDLGTGADTAKDDGIYSSYFVGFTGDGVYQVTLEVENEAVGQAKKITFPQTLGGVMPPNWSDTQEPVLVDVDPFMRATQAVGFTVVSAPPADELGQVDTFPPARVTDLRVASVSRRQGRLTLRWTAPGDDYDVGTAATYDLRCSQNFKEISSDFGNAKAVSASDVLSGDLSAPQPSGSEETFVLRLPVIPQSAAPGDSVLFLAYRVRAIDDSGRAGEASNVATVVVDYGAGGTTTRSIMPQTPTPTPPPPTTPAVLSTAPDIHLLNLGRHMAVVLGVAGSLAFFSAVVLVVACRTKWLRDREHGTGNGTTVYYRKARPTRRVGDACVLEDA